MRITAAGSLPGDDFRGALSAMAEALPVVLPWPELPARGPGSQVVGRALGLIDGLGFDLTPAGWRLVSGASSEHRRAQAAWRADLDDAEELLQGFDATLKVGVAGPWTLAAGVERPTGDRLLADPGARRELSQALTEGVSTLRSDLARRIPGANIWLQVDEPSLMGVALGRVPTASGFARHPAVDRPELVAALAPLSDNAVLHCCAAGDWLPLAESAGFGAVSVDTRLLHTTLHLDRLGEWLDVGRHLLAGIVDSSTASPQPTDRLVTEALRVLRPLERDWAATLDQLTWGTGCGLAAWRAGDILGQLAALREAAPLITERLLDRG